MSARVVGIQVGKPRTFSGLDEEGRSWRSAIDKRAVTGPVFAGPEGLEGDAQVDRRYHGGPDRALLAYAAGHYDGWRRELGRTQLPCGSFGENLTVEGVDESIACVGDRWALGQAQLEISSPRMPCSKLARHLGAPDAIERALSTARTGFYLRVRRPGLVAPGPLLFLEHPFPALTIARALRALLAPDEDPEGVAAFIACPALSESLRAALKRSARRAS